jgi:hypothetical protein
MSNETETSSAGEQLVRDTFDVRQVCQKKDGLFFSNSLLIIYILREPYASKNPSMNLYAFLLNLKNLWKNLVFNTVHTVNKISSHAGL